MDLKIKIETTNNCSINIYDSSEYYDSVADKNYEWVDCVTADIITTNFSTGGVVNAIITQHTNTNYGKAITYSPQTDAWFTVTHIILPSKSTIQSWIDDENQRYKLDPFNLIYCVNDKNAPYKYNKISGQFEMVEWSEVVGINADAKSTISEYTQEFVSVCNLKNCYINLCQQIFQSRMQDGSCSGRTRACKNNNKSREDLWYRRDLVWSALNVIKYMVEDNQYAAAELLIEQLLQSCNGVCTGVVKPGKDCGCSS